MGYSKAGFEVTGVDKDPQPRYPFRFHQTDAFEFLVEQGHEYDLISVSPPCQKYSNSTKQWRKQGREYPDLIADFRKLLVQSGKPYVIENIPNSPLINPIFLNGAMFGLCVHRPRLFECNFPVIQPFMPKVPKPVEMGRPVKEGEYIQPVGHFVSVAYAREQMQIDWMTRGELSQAIPPAYTEYIGRQFLYSIENLSLPTGTYVTRLLESRI